MLKWTASAQKLHNGDTTSISQTPNSTLTTTIQTPRFNGKKRSKRRATIANKENVTMLTSTPMINRTSNSPLVLVPLADILNVTPESTAENRTPGRRRVASTGFTTNSRRHSSASCTLTQMPQYAATLPKYEEEYSPSTILPTGQQLALRGLLPDRFMDKPRYFTTPEVPLAKKQDAMRMCTTVKKRKLEKEFVAIAKKEDEKGHEEEEEEAFIGSQQLINNSNNNLNHTGLVSNKMSDQTLDHLIDAILDSARKDEKRKKPRKSFNLRRRTLLKNQVEQQQDIVLSPSYTAGDDPCSDLSFLDCEPLNINTAKFQKITPQRPQSSIPSTPVPANQQPVTPLTQQLLLQMPTPPQRRDSFSLATPVRSKLKRRSESKARVNTNAKKFKVDSRNYFEVGVALPSIYV